MKFLRLALAYAKKAIIFTANTISVFVLALFIIAVIAFGASIKMTIECAKSDGPIMYVLPFDRHIYVVDTCKPYQPKKQSFGKEKDRVIPL